MRVQVEFDPFEFVCDDEEVFYNDDALKELMLKHHADDILRSMKMTRHSSQTDSKNSVAAISYTCAGANGTHFDQNRRLALLDTIAQVQMVFLDTESLSEAFGCLLSGLLTLVGSEFGFIGEAKYTEDGDMYLQIHSRASASLMMDPLMQHFFESSEKEVVNLYNLHSLFGECLLTKRPVLSNDVKTDSRAGGVPPGHPVLNRFLGVPIFKKHGEILGIVGVANKGGEGYTEADIDLLGPFVLTCSSVIQAYRQIRKNENLINDLEEKVKERTDRLQRANGELEEANRRVMQASAAQLEHFACMSHEIRTPLNCIIGLSSLLQDSVMNPMQDEAVRMIVQSGDLLLTVVNDVLDYSKLESGNVEIEIRHSSLQDTLNAVVHSVAMKAQGKNISLRTLYDVALPEFLRTDSRRVQQILYNLLGNAVKFSLEGGVVDLHVGLSDGKVSPEAYSPNPYVPDSTSRQFIRFVVKDYGRGISKADYGRIFEPFRQATYETEQVYGGTGLGLAITAKLVNGLGGRLYVESMEHQWSRFTVDLPYDRSSSDPVESGENLHNTTVFFICNDSAICTQVGQTFRAFGINYIRFNSSSEMQSKICCDGFLDRGRKYVCLVQEELFSEMAFDQLNQLSGKAVLLTFGPHFEIARSQGHFRSLVQVIPSVLVKSIGSYVSAAEVDCDLLDRTSAGPNPALRRSARAARYQEYSVLVAEDNKINQKVMVRMLKRLGIENVDVVENGKLAVEAEARKQYDVVLMDMQMPVMDGLAACELITQRELGHRLASVVFVTAHVSNAFEGRCEKAGASGFLSKPFNISDIEHCMQNIYLMRDGDHKSTASDLYLDEGNSISEFSISEIANELNDC